MRKCKDVHKDTLIERPLSYCSAQDLVTRLSDGRAMLATLYQLQLIVFLLFEMCEITMNSKFFPGVTTCGCYPLTFLLIDW